MMNFMLAIPAFVWLLVAALFYAWGEYLSKEWALKPTLASALFVTLVYAVGSVIWLPALLHKNQLAVTGTLYLVLAVIATVSVGLLAFHEHLSPLQWAGVALGAVAMVLLSN